MSKSNLTNAEYLRAEQYKDDSNLNTRIEMHMRYSTNPYGLISWEFDQYDLPRDAKILEIGCGPGNLWKENLARIPYKWQIIMTDFSPGMVNVARNNLGAGRFSYINNDTQWLSFPTSYFDAVIANHMLYHVPDLKRAFMEINRVLRPAGALYAVTNGADHMHEVVDLINVFSPDNQYLDLELSFNLENGEDLLTPWFSRIERRDYPDTLDITEAESLTTYVASTSRFDSILNTQQRKDTFTNYIQGILDQYGKIHVTKSVGMFIARTAE